MDPSTLHIGLDLDNTIILYDELFHALALERDLIEPSLPVSKQAVREAVREVPGGFPRWVELQALVYGPEIKRARLAPGVESFLEACCRREIRVSVISHKTQFPAMGVQTNLHDAARGFLGAKGLLDPERYGLSQDAVSFRETRAKKIARIVELSCTHFVDDLIEVLREEAFPKHVERLHFGGSLAHPTPGLVSVPTWADITAHFFPTEIP